VIQRNLNYRRAVTKITSATNRGGHSSAGKEDFLRSSAFPFLRGGICGIFQL